MRRKFTDFVWLRTFLVNQQHKLFEKKEHWEAELKKKEHVTEHQRKRFQFLEWFKFPELPGDTWAAFFGFGLFDDKLIENRKKGLNEFMRSCAMVRWIKENETFIDFCTNPDVEAVKAFVRI